MYKSGGLKKSIKASRKMKKGGANDIQGIDVDSLPQNIQQQAVKLNGLIIEYNNVKDDSQKNVTALLNIANQIVEILKILAPSKPGIFGIFSRKQTTAAAPPALAPVVPQQQQQQQQQQAPAAAPAPAPAAPSVPVTPAAAITAADQQAEEEEEEEEEATELPQQIQVTPPTVEEAPLPLAPAPLTEEQKAEAARQNAIKPVEGGRKKKATRKVKRGGAIDMSKLYNVSGLIVDSKDPVAMAAQVSQDNTPMPFSSSGQGITYSAGIPEQFMRDLNPTLGMAGGKKRTVGSAKTQDKQRAGSAKTKTQDKKRKDSAKTKSKK